MAVSSGSPETKQPSTEVNAGTASAAGEAKEKVQELPSTATQKVLDVASDVSNKAQDWASNVASKAQDTAATAVDRTNDGIAAVGHQMAALGGSVRKVAPQDGMIGSAATTVADQLQAGGRYLEGHGLQDMGKDLTDVVRNYPVPAVLVGFGLGFMLGMMWKRS